MIPGEGPGGNGGPDFRAFQGPLGDGKSPGAESASLVRRTAGDPPGSQEKVTPPGPGKQTSAEQPDALISRQGPGQDVNVEPRAFISRAAGGTVPIGELPRKPREAPEPPSLQDQLQQKIKELLSSHDAVSLVAEKGSSDKERKSLFSDGDHHQRVVTVTDGNTHVGMRMSQSPHITDASGERVMLPGRHMVVQVVDEGNMTYDEIGWHVDQVGNDWVGTQWGSPENHLHAKIDAGFVRFWKEGKGGLPALHPLLRLQTENDQGVGTYKLEQTISDEAATDITRALANGQINIELTTNVVTHYRRTGYHVTGVDSSNAKEPGEEPGYQQEVPLHPGEPTQLAGAGGDGPGKGKKPTEKGDAGENEPHTPQEIQRKSVEKAQALLEELKYQSKAIFTRSDAMYSLAALDIISEDAQAVREWAQRVDELPEKYNFELATLYFKAASLGDEAASERLAQLLHAEQEKARSNKDQAAKSREIFSYETQSFMLNYIMRECAQAGVPADQWINDYAIDANHKAELKMDYYYVAKYEEGDAKVIGARYRDELANQFIQGTDMTKEYAMSKAGAIFSIQDDNHKKEEIFRRYQQLTTEAAIDYRYFVDFATYALKSPEALEYSDAKWLEEMVQICHSALLEQGVDAFGIYKQSAGLEITLARHFGATPAELIDKIDELTARLLQMDIPDKPDGTSANYFRNKERVADSRNEYLDSIAMFYAEQGDFHTAQVFIAAIAGEEKKSYAIAKLLEQANTIDDVVAIRPSEMELAFNEDLGDLFKEKEVLLTRDTQALQELARSYAQRIQSEEDHFNRHMLSKCLAATYELDSEQGHTLSIEVLNILKERALDPNIFMLVAQAQVNSNDPSGFQTFYENIERFEDPEDRLREYAHLARLTTQEIEKAKKAPEQGKLEHENTQQVAVTNVEDGKKGGERRRSPEDLRDAFREFPALAEFVANKLQKEYYMYGNSTLEEAQVICFAETHDMPKELELGEERGNQGEILELITELAREGDELLLEGWPRSRAVPSHAPEASRVPEFLVIEGWDDMTAHAEASQRFLEARDAAELADRNPGQQGLQENAEEKHAQFLKVGIKDRNPSLRRSVSDSRARIPDYRTFIIAGKLHFTHDEGLITGLERFKFCVIGVPKKQES